MVVSKEQEAMAYTIYMMLGSYFKKAVCNSNIRLGQLKLEYCEQKRDKQIKNEERCDYFIENKMIPNLPEIIFGDMVDVYFIAENGIVYTKFVGFDWHIIMWADTSSKKTIFQYKFVEAEEQDGTVV